MSLCYFCDEQYEEAKEKITSVLKNAREQNLTEWEFNGELLLAAIFFAQRDQLWQIFRSIDKDGNGTLSDTEIQQALSNGTWDPFSILTVKAMIDLFSGARADYLNFEEFTHLWTFIQNWQKFFTAYDKDKSGYIDFNELKQALTNSGEFSLHII
nr:unnamed protein product [Spirometra erinaceieuropaei]